MVTQLLVLVLAAGVAAEGDLRSQPEAAGALGPAIAATIERYNQSEDARREKPQVERVGPAQEPSLLRATYRHAGPAHQIMGTEPGASPVVTVRVRASELEKRATNVNAGDLESDFAKAPWRETPRGYILDFRLRWTGSEWEQLGEPTAYPTLGVVGRP